MDPESEFYQRDRTIQPPALTPHYKTSVLRSPRMVFRCAAASMCESRSAPRSIRLRTVRAAPRRRPFPSS